jgi:hypothetical protein
VKRRASWRSAFMTAERRMRSRSRPVGSMFRPTSGSEPSVGAIHELDNVGEVGGQGGSQAEGHRVRVAMGLRVRSDLRYQSHRREYKGDVRMRTSTLDLRLRSFGLRLGLRQQGGRFAPFFFQTWLSRSPNGPCITSK